jgi:4-hydroxybenzoate polyprenyltransferase
MRLDRWPRSLAIFVGSAAFFLLYRQAVSDLSLLEIALRSAAAFILTWAISTANYIINEIADAPFDIHHPTKQHRPLISGEIRKSALILGALLLSVLSLGMAYLSFSPAFFLSLLALLIAGFIYNIKPIRTKDIPFLDSVSESANNPIRFFIGWFAFASPQVFPPVSLLLCWWSFGNFLMVAKRLSEFRLLQEKAGDYRQSLSRYSRNSLLIGMAVSALVFFITYFSFALTFQLQSFLYLSPLVFLYFFIFFRKTLGEKEVMEEPERLLKNPAFALYTLVIALAFFLSFLWDNLHQ